MLERLTLAAFLAHQYSLPLAVSDGHRGGGDVRNARGTSE